LPALKLTDYIGIQKAIPDRAAFDVNRRSEMVFLGRKSHGRTMDRNSIKRWPRWVPPLLLTLIAATVFWQASRFLGRPQARDENAQSATVARDDFSGESQAITRKSTPLSINAREATATTTNTISDIECAETALPIPQAGLNSPFTTGAPSSEKTGDMFGPSLLSKADDFDPMEMPAMLPIPKAEPLAIEGRNDNVAKATNGSPVFNSERNELSVINNLKKEVQADRPEAATLSDLSDNRPRLEPAIEPENGQAQEKSKAFSNDSELLPEFDNKSLRSEQMENIARQADQQIRHGFELAGKGAYFAARAEFIAALRLLSQGLDADSLTKQHSRALALALRAIKEADDFIPNGSTTEADLSVRSIVGNHETPALKRSDLSGLTPMMALKCYLTFAQEQLAEAAGGEIAGSMALHALGKLHATLAKNKIGSVRAAEPKAMVFFQAALLVHGRNYMAANDLGVLLARCGNYADACAMLNYSLSLHSDPTGWHNLAVVYQGLGQRELAQRAQRQCDEALRLAASQAGGKTPPAQQMVRWVDTQTFAQSTGEPAYVGPAKPAENSAQKIAAQPAATPTPAFSQRGAPARDVPVTGRLSGPQQPVRN
jgi:tetratricopeptide (TPR) repeat protein